MSVRPAEFIRPCLDVLNRRLPLFCVVTARSSPCAGGAEAGASLGGGTRGGRHGEDREEGVTEFWEFQRRIPFSGFSVNGLTP